MGAKRQQNMDCTIMTLVGVFQLGSPAPRVNVIRAGRVYVKCIRSQAGDIIGMHARDAQQSEMFTSISMEFLAYARDDEVFFSSEDVPRDKRYMIADISERSIPREYSTLHHRVLREKTKIDSKNIIHTHASRGATKRAAIFENRDKS